VADVTEKHHKVTIAPMAGTASLWEKGWTYLVMLMSPVELTPEGFVDLAARKGLKTIAMVTEDGLVAKAAAKGVGEGFRAHSDARQGAEAGRVRDRHADFR
jgi:hypothetical protein